MTAAITKTKLHITSKSRAHSIANQRLAHGQIRLATGGGIPRMFQHLLVQVLTDPAITPGQAVVVAYPPTHAHDTWRIFTGELITVTVKDRRSVLVFADDVFVPVEDVLAVTF